MGVLTKLVLLLAITMVFVSLIEAGGRGRKRGSKGRSPSGSGRGRGGGNGKPGSSSGSDSSSSEEDEKAQNDKGGKRGSKGKKKWDPLKWFKKAADLECTSAPEDKCDLVAEALLTIQDVLHPDLDEDGGVEQVGWLNRRKRQVGSDVGGEGDDPIELVDPVTGPIKLPNPEEPDVEPVGDKGKKRLASLCKCAMRLSHGGKHCCQVIQNICAEEAAKLPAKWLAKLNQGN